MSGVTVELRGRCDLSEQDLEVLFPAGAPAILTAEAVIAALRALHTCKSEVLAAFFSDDDLQVSVSVVAENPHWSQDTALFPEDAPERYVEMVSVW